LSAGTVGDYRAGETRAVETQDKRRDRATVSEQTVAILLGQSPIWRYS
jgi:hypothetical protein